MWLGWASCVLPWATPCQAQGVAAAPAAAIAAQPLSAALAEFARQTTLQVIYVSSLARGLRSHPVAAGLPPADTLTQLLTGTGLRFEFLNERTVRLLPAPRATPVPATTLVAAGSGTPQASGPWSHDRLEEVVVTSTKREESLNVVPISATVMSLAAMDAAGVKSFNDIAALAPGVEYDFSTQWGPGILTNLAIRGISADKGAATTGIYLGDVPIQVPHTTFSSFYPVAFDLERVEVLRGPQGTLFGASAEGGAVRFIANEPSLIRDSALYRSEVATTAHGGMSYEAGAAAGGPLVDGRLGVRASAWYRKDGGYVDRVDPFSGATLDADANRALSKAARLAFVFAPGDNLRISPSIAYQSVDLNDTPIYYTYLSRPGDGILRNGKLLRQPGTDHFTVATVRIERDFEAATLTAITSLVDRSASATVDTTNVAGVAFFGGYGNPLGPAYPASYADAIPTLLTLRQITLAQELRLASADTATPLRWVGGLYYTRVRKDALRDTYAIADPQDPGIYTKEHNADMEVSAYGQASLALAAHLRAGLGLRVGVRHVDGITYQAGFANGGTAPPVRGTLQETLPLTPRAELSWQPDAQHYYYATVARGFRVGGANAAGQAPCAGRDVPVRYRADTTWSYEVGAKNALFDHRLQLAASAYQIRWNGLQESLSDACNNSYTANAGHAISSGFDLTLDTQPSAHTNFGLSLGYVDVRYRGTVYDGSGQIIVEHGTAVGGEPAVPAPWNGTATAQYHRPAGRGFDGYLRAQLVVHSHNPGPFTEQNPQAISWLPAARADPATSNLGLQFGLVRDALDLRLAVNNVLNASPQLQRYADAPDSTLFYAYTLRPRTVALSASWRFGL